MIFKEGTGKTEQENKCIECENNTIIELSSLQTEYYYLKDEYKALEKAYNSYREYAEKKIERLSNEAEKSEMWHKDFLVISDKLDIFRNDPYFENVELKTIAGLAKKSTNITKENCEMMHDFEDMKVLLENIEQTKLTKDEKKMLNDSINLCKKYTLCEE